MCVNFIRSYGVEKLLVCFQSVAGWLHSGWSFDTIFKKIVAEIKASELPHMLKLWLMVGDTMLLVIIFI